MEISWRRRERQTKTLEFFNEFKRDCGGGGSRTRVRKHVSNDFENAMGSIGKKRQKATVQVQNRYRKSPASAPTYKATQREEESAETIRLLRTADVARLLDADSLRQHCVTRVERPRPQ
jgi:hypothetical protein